MLLFYNVIILLWQFVLVLVFSARQHICRARYMLSQFRLSACLSHGWISQKRLKLGSCNFHHTVAPSLKFLQDKFHPKILTGAWSGKKSYLLALCVNISKTVRDSPKLLLMTNRKLHMRFRLAPSQLFWPDVGFPARKKLTPSLAP